MYYQQHLGMDLLKSGIFSVLPWITMAIFANLGGWLADSLIHKGMSVTRVRKIMQTVCRPESAMLRRACQSVARGSIVAVVCAFIRSGQHYSPVKP